MYINLVLLYCAGTNRTHFVNFNEEIRLHYINCNINDIVQLQLYACTKLCDSVKIIGFICEFLTIKHVYSQVYFRIWQQIVRHKEGRGRGWFQGIYVSWPNKSHAYNYLFVVNVYMYIT